jgi:magnesium-transporting ATPase (P-type)
MKNFKLVSKMTRNQTENFEKLFRDIESGMRFLGCLGIKNTIPEEVKTVVGNLVSAKMKVSMLTGDNLENATMAGIELGLSNSDFSDTSSYYSLRFDSEQEGWIQIRRILEFLYESLKIVNVKDSQNKIKRNRQEQRQTAQSYPYTRKRSSNDEKPAKNRKNPEETELIKLRKEMHKTMLISGNSVSIIE